MRWAAVRSHAFPDPYIAHGDYLGSLAEARHTDNATFEWVPGLLSDRMVSLRSFNIPDHSFGHGGFRMRLQKFDDSEVYRKNFTFKQVPGLDAGNGVSVEAVNFPGPYICRKDKQLHRIKNDGSDPFRKNAIFDIVEPLARKSARAAGCDGEMRS